MGFNFTSLTPSWYIEKTQPTDTNFSDFQEGKTILLSQASKIVSTRGFDFEFKGCQPPSRDELICSFIVKNNQHTRSLSLWTTESKIVDSKDNIFLGAYGQLGQPNSSSPTLVNSEELPPQIPIRGEILFRNIPNTSNIEIEYVEFNFDQFNIWFTPGS